MRVQGSGCRSQQPNPTEEHHDDRHHYGGGLLHHVRGHDLPPEGRAPQRYLKPGSPLLIVLGDDGKAPTGPAGFPQARRLLAWSDTLILHSCGGEEGHYTAAVGAARLMRRALMIETGTARREAWLAVVRAEIARRDGCNRLPLVVMDIRVRPGAPAHPLEKAA